VRKNTIKSVQIIQAYKEAIALAEKGQTDVVRPGTTEQTVPVDKPAQPVQQELGIFSRIFVKVFGTVFFFAIIGFIIGGFLEGFDIAHPLYFILSTYEKVPDDNLFKEIISFPLAIVIGGLFNMVFSMLTVIPVYYLWGLLDNTKYEKYMYKLGMIIVAVINFCLVYFSGLHMPFEHASSDYYEFLHQISRFFAWACGPIYLLVEWISEVKQYKKVKPIYDSALVEKL
jgi:hypothetical protein